MVQEDTCSTTSLLEFGNDFALTTGAIYVRLTGKGGFECGKDATANFFFGLDQDAPCEGYFVQKIEIWCMVQKECTECRCPVFHQDASPSEPDIVMYEAMKIRAGTKAKHGNLDDSGVQILQNSCGLSIAVGTIKFFCKNPAESPNGVGTEDLEAAGWHDWMFYSGECSNTTAGTYISKDGKTFTPAFWGQQPVERSAWRMAGASWNCCSGDPNFVADFQGWEPRSRLAGGEKS